MKYVLIYLVIINALALALMLADKNFSKKRGHRRIRERTLLAAAWMGGSLGAFLGMVVFRHKTCHRQFLTTLPALLLIHAGIAVLLYLGLSPA